MSDVVLDKEHKSAISNSVLNFKKDEVTTKKVIDTVLFSIDIGKENNEEISVIIEEYFYGYGIKQIKNNDGYHIYSLKTENAKVDIRGICSFGYITIKISSLEKLARDIGVDINHDKHSFAKDVRGKIINKLFKVYIPTYEVNVKRCDLAIDIRFPKVENRFKIFCKKLTATILNMDFPYYKAEKEEHFNTGYLKSIRGGNKVMRFYNKELKEDDRGRENYYQSTYRMEYIFKDSQVYNYLGGKNLYLVNLEKGFGRILSLCKRASEKYKEKICKYNSGEISKDGHMYRKYVYSCVSNNMFDEAWRHEVDLSRMLSGKSALLIKDAESSFYQRANTKKYSYIDFVLNRNLKPYYDLFNVIINNT